MKEFLKKFAQNESGATALEYGLIAAGVGLVVYGGASYLGDSLGDTFRTIGTNVEKAGVALPKKEGD